MAIERAFAAGIPAAVLAALTACAGPGSDVPSAAPLAHARSAAYERATGSSGFNFMTVDDPADPSFNEILGVNDGSKLVGFYGSGSASDPSEGYIVVSPFGSTNFREEAYPGAADTELTGLNDKKTFVGFFRRMNNDIRGLVLVSGIWNNYKHPRGMPRGKSVTELLGVNSSDLAVGYYKDSSGVNEAFTLDIPSGTYHPLSPPGGNNSIATGISGRGDIVGYLQKSGHSVGFLLRKGSYTEFSYPSATDTKFLGVTVYDQIVGSYTESSGATHGFLLTNPLKPSIAWKQIDEPNAAGTTVVTGINQSDDIAGYYVDSSGNTNGFFATPQSLR
ncbi:MAG: hypothetical protein JO190_07955 [Candidatus Eremiobacteraeota bacterium]|nr:hypothetical protein [Candidatus Eremiobacteraeota bacterium]